MPCGADPTLGLTVNTSLTSVAACRRFGFTCTGELFEPRGQVCQPMVLALEDRAP
ncbi:GNAT family N-acetyltransferase [Pseudomonas tohonis]|uniref:GNAT family N-acetyltransferase n=1 Tax=Pseudomonas tohonis TaxID=2725477 RepID=UPI001F2F8A49|nr:GNAT family N-acetyltransferase [Pseudomonas tohonis]